MTDAPSSERPGPPPQVDPARDPLRRAFNWAGVLCIAAFFALGFKNMGSVGTSPDGRLDSSRRTMSLLAALSFFVGAGCFTAASIRGAQLAGREREARLLALSAPALGRRAATPALSPISSASRPPSISGRTVALAALAVTGAVGLGFGVSVLARRQSVVAEVAIPAGTPDFAQFQRDQAPGLYAARLVWIQLRDDIGKCLHVGLSGRESADETMARVQWSLVGFDPLEMEREGSVKFKETRYPWLDTMWLKYDRDANDWARPKARPVLVRVRGTATDLEVEVLTPTR